MKIIINEKQYVNILTENNSDCEKKLYDSINNWRLKTIFQKPIDEILEPQKQKWITFGDVKTYTDVLKLIGKTDSEIKSILDTSFVYDEKGEWDRINKLNTNYSDTARWVIDVLKKQGKDICKIQKKIELGDNSDLKLLAQDMLKNKTEYWHDYLSPQKEKYVENNTKNSIIGDISENVVKDFLLEKGWKLIYHAKEGSPIDTKLGIDIIMSSPEGKIAKIQVKTVGSITQVAATPCENAGVTLTKKKIKGGFSVYTRGGAIIRDTNINLVAYVSKNERILVLRKFSPVSIVNNRCVDQPSFQFPSNPKGGTFFIDHESVVFSKI